EKSAARAPAIFFVVNSGLTRHVRERAIAIVVKQNVVTPKAAEEIVPAVVVVVAHACASLPACARHTRFFSDVGKRAVAIILVQMRGWRLSLRPLGIQSRAVG